jgi:hypothetical protein
MQQIAFFLLLSLLSSATSQHLPKGLPIMQKRAPYKMRRIHQLGYKDSNLEMTESESVALPFGDSPSTTMTIIYDLF